MNMVAVLVIGFLCLSVVGIAAAAFLWIWFTPEQKRDNDSKE